MTSTLFFSFLSMIFSYLFIYFALMSYCAFRFLRNHSQGNRIHPSALGIPFPTHSQMPRSAFLNPIGKEDLNQQISSQWLTHLERGSLHRLAATLWETNEKKKGLFMVFHCLKFRPIKNYCLVCSCILIVYMKGR